MAGSGPKDNEVFNLDRIKNLVELMQEYGLSEVDLRHDKQRIKLQRGRPADAAVPAVPPPAQAAAPEAAPVIQKGLRSEDKENIVLIKSPMVGTFYGKPNPDSPPFVKVGDHVSPDQTVCIIEAMKVFNEIPAEVSGTVVAILANDEEAVDFNKPLFKVDTGK